MPGALASKFLSDTGQAANANLAAYAVVPDGAELVFTLSNLPATDGGGTVIRSADGSTLTTQIVVDEDGLHDLHVDGAGVVWVSGTDPAESHDFGNIYTDESGSWEKKRTLPLTIHTWGLSGDATELLAGVGAHDGTATVFEGRVMRSTDGGDTWAQNVFVYGVRVYDVLRIGARIFATAHASLDSSSGRLYYSDNNGANWTQVAGVIPDDLTRLTVRAGNLMVMRHDRQRIYEIDAALTITTHVLLGIEVGSQVFNAIAVVGSDVYIMGTFGWIWKTSNFSSFELFSYVEAAASIAYWPNDDSLIVSGRGTGAQLWKIPLP